MWHKSNMTACSVEFVKWWSKILRLFLGQTDFVPKGSLGIEGFRPQSQHEKRARTGLNRWTWVGEGGRDWFVSDCFTESLAAAGRVNKMRSQGVWKKLELSHNGYQVFDHIKSLSCVNFKLYDPYVNIWYNNALMSQKVHRSVIRKCNHLPCWT